MAIVTKMEEVSLQGTASHTYVDSTYSIVTDDKGVRYLQIDTYGSAQRQMPGKKSQSIRFSPEAIAQLRQILKERF